MEQKQDAVASVIIESDNNDLALALGKVVGHAIQNVGFTNVTVTHNADVSSEGEGEPQTDFEQGKSLLDAMADANPALFHRRIEVVSACLEPELEVEMDLPPNEAADLEVALELDRDEVNERD
jgi:hypothetical protein